MTNALRIGFVLVVFGGVVDGQADELRYKDGHVAVGRLISDERGLIVFQSSRFGELRATTEEATVVIAPEKNPENRTPVIDREILPVAKFEQPKPLRWWEGWVGRLAFSAELVDDDRDRNEWLGELRLERRWAVDDVRFEPRYEFKREAGFTQTDLLKVRGYWRHDFPHRLFSLYKPYVERNQQFVVEGFDANYLLWQHQAGGGIRVVDQPAAQVRVGVAENLFRLSFAVNPDTIQIWADSVFIEAEIKLPFGWSLREQGQWVHYHSFADENGWTNDLELTKQFTDTVSLGLRHEYRRNAPELRVSNYTKLRLLLGYTF